MNQKKIFVPVFLVFIISSLYSGPKSLNNNFLLSKATEFISPPDSANLKLCYAIVAYNARNPALAYQQVKEYITKGANVNCDCDVEYTTRKIVSFIPIVKEFVRNRYRYYTVNTTPLILAVQTTDLTLIEILLQKGADLDKKNQQNISPLETALGIDNSNVINYLIGKGANVKSLNLKYSANSTVIKNLVQNGADPKTIDINFALGDYQKLTDLLSLGAEVNRYPLQYKQICKDIKIATLLIDKGLNFNAPGASPDDCPMLFAAIEYSPDDQLFDLLVNKGANVFVECKSGFAENLLFKAIKMNRLSIIKKLIDKKLDVNKPEWTGRTPIYFAVEKNSSEMINILVDNGADLKYNIYFHKTPLMFAVDYKYFISAKVLIDRGSDINYKDDDETCLHKAIKNNDLAMVMLLVQNKIDLSCKLKGKSYIEYAKEKEASSEIIGYLSNLK